MKWLKRHEWNLVLLAAALAFGCGVVGTHQYLQAIGKNADWSDLVYFTLRLFLFNYDLQGEGVPYAAAPPLLQVARFLAPTTIFYAAVKGFMLAAACQVNLWRLRNWRGHVVVCGAGKMGRQLAVSLRLEGRKVVVIEKDEQCDALADLRALGIRVVLGSATNPEVLRQARVGHASLMVTLTSSEETNLEAALTAAGSNHIKSLKLLVHAPWSFAELFETQSPFARIQAGLQARFFDDEAIAARLLVREFPINPEGDAGGSRRPPRLLLIGDGTILVELLGAALNHYQFPGPELPEITVVTPAKDAFLQRFPAGLDQLDLVANIKFMEVAAETIGRLNMTIGSIRPELIFVGFQSDMAGLNAARSLAQRPDWDGAEIVLCVKPSTNIPRLLHAKEIAGRVKIRNLVEVGCNAEMVVRESLDGDARKIHERYVAAQKALGGTSANNPVLVAWEELPESLRRTNRSQADHNTVKRRTLIRSTSVETVEALSEAEHRRWMADRLLAGWQHGAVRDNVRKLHPSIKPYSQLSESEKQKDRDTVLAVMKELKG